MRAMRLILAFCLFAGFVVKPVTAQNVCAANVGLASASSVGQWQKWEQTLASTQDYVGQDKRGNPYKDLTIRVTFTNCGVNNAVLSTLQTYGFWYGVEKDATGKLVDRPKSFRIRGSFSVGTWIWQTTCSGKTSALSSTTPPLQVADCANDPGLNQKGKFTVTADSTNSLYRSGLLSLSEDRRYLTYARTYSSSGATQRIPFFWLGDTAWNVPITTTQKDWQTYVNNRAKDTSLDRPSTAFTVVQLAVSPKAAGPADVDGNPPFYQPGDPACPDSSQAPNKCSSWNAKYWAGLDEKIQYANQQGLVVFLAGIMEPLQKLVPTDVSSDAGTDLAIVADSTALVTFARNVASRYYGNFVVFSPGFDHKVPPNLAVIRLVGQTLRSNTRNLITNHPAGSSASGDLAKLQADSWLDFQMYQSGTPGDNETAERENMTDRAGFLATALQSASLLKSAINGEATYDGAGVYPANHTPYRVRQTAYLSFLSGAMGYTAGTCGLTDWGYGIGGCPTGLGWNAAITRLTSRSMRHLRFILQSVSWQRLRPESLRIQGQGATKPDKKAALTYDGSSVLMAYLPGEPPKVQIDFNLKLDSQNKPIYQAVPKLAGVSSKSAFLSSGWAYRWLSPRTGKTAPAAAGFQDLEYISPGVFRFSKPANCDNELGDNCSSLENDWVLRLTKGALTPPPSGWAKYHLEVSNDTSSESGEPRIIAQVIDEELKEARSYLELGDQYTNPVSPQVAYEPEGNAMVVWQSDSSESTAVVGRVLNSQGDPVSKDLNVSVGSFAAVGHPTITALTNGNFVVAWSSLDAAGEGPWIQFSLFDRNGLPLGSNSITSACVSVAGDFPQAASLDGGGFSIAWELKEGSGIYFNQFDKEGNSVGGGKLSQSDPGWPVLESISSDGSNLSVSWNTYGYDAAEDTSRSTGSTVQNPPKTSTLCH